MYAKVMDTNLKGTFSFCQYFVKDIASVSNTREAPPGGYSIVCVCARHLRSHNNQDTNGFHLVQKYWQYSKSDWFGE
jgi:hypothetical protein